MKKSYHHGDLRAALLKEAEKLLDEHGAEKLTLRDVARNAGVSHGAPAHHFGNKRGLLTALAVIIVGRLESRVRQTLRELPSNDPRNQLTAVFMTYLDVARSHSEQFLLHTSPSLLDYSDTPLRRARTGLGNILDDLLENACQEGWIERKNLQAARFASQAIVLGYAGILTGGFPHYLAETPAEGARMLEQSAEPAIKLFAHSVLRPPKGFSEG